MDRTNCKTYFLITGDFHPDEISAILKIDRTGGHSIGENKRYGSGVFDWAGWEYGTDYVDTLYADEQADSVVNQLLHKVDELLLIRERYRCRFILMQVPKVEEGLTPAMGFSKKVIDFCSRTKTEIQIDLYVNPFD